MFLCEASVQLCPQDTQKGCVPLANKLVHSLAHNLIQGKQQQIITSGALSPTLGHPIAMAYLDPDFVGDPVIDVRGTSLPATVVPLPFYRRTQQTGA